MGENVKNNLAGYDSTAKGFILALGLGKARGWRLARALGLGGGDHRCAPEGVPRGTFEEMARAAAWWGCEACPASWRAWGLTLTREEREGLQEALRGWLGEG